MQGPLTSATAEPAQHIGVTFTPRATELICVFAFLLLNPFLATFALALFSLKQRVPVLVFAVSATLSFTLFFYFREYGVEMYTGSSDDIPQYISMYNSNAGLSFAGVWRRFIEMPSGFEPLWHLPGWLLINTLGAADPTFVLLHYLLLFSALFLALATVSTQYLLPLTVVYFFLTPISLDSLAHIWRQQFGFSLYLGGLGLALVRGKKSGPWLIAASGLMHLSCFFFAALFFITRWIRRCGGFDTRLRTSVVLVMVLLIMATLTASVVAYLEMIGLSRVTGYFEGYEVDTLRVYLVIALYAVPLLCAAYLLRADAMNQVLTVACFAVFSLVLAIPSANSIYDRLLMFVLPLWGSFFFRTLLLNTSARRLGPVLVLVFLFGAVRLHAPIAQGMGVANFLAFGHAFDPFMGIAAMLVF